MLCIIAFHCLTFPVLDSFLSKPWDGAKPPNLAIGDETDGWGVRKSGINFILDMVSLGPVLSPINSTGLPVSMPDLSSPACWSPYISFTLPQPNTCFRTLNPCLPLDNSLLGLYSSWPQSYPKVLPQVGWSVLRLWSNHWDISKDNYCKVSYRVGRD